MRLTDRIFEYLKEYADNEDHQRGSDMIAFRLNVREQDVFRVCEKLIDDGKLEGDSYYGYSIPLSQNQNQS